MPPHLEESGTNPELRMSSYPREIAFLLQGCVRPILSAFVLCGLSAAVDMMCMVLLPLFLFTTLTGAEPVSARIPLAEALNQLIPSYDALVGIVIAVFLLRGALSLYVGAQLTRLSETIRAALIRRIAHHYLTCPYQDYVSRSVAWALTMVGAYTGTFAGSVALPLLRLLLDLLTIVAILGFLLFVDHRVVGLIAVVLAAVATGYYLAVRRVSERHSRRLSELQARFNQHLSRALHAPREVRIFQLQSHFLEGMQEVFSKSADAIAQLSVVGSLPRVLGELTLIGLALGYLVYRIHSGIDTSLLISQLGLLAFAGLRMLPAFALSMSNVATLKAGRHATGLMVKELRGVASAPRSAAANAAIGPATATELFQSLELRNVSFAYNKNASSIVYGVDLLIKAGESIGLVGVSGAGKSTLGDILLGLLKPTEGEILVNGVPSRLDSDQWWQTVGFVPQTVFLSNDTLVRNIAFGVPDGEIDRTKARRVASMAQLDDVIQASFMGLDTPVGDYGVRLSGGQRQRVAIARALYRERQFLVLDEATSALDDETEKAVVRAVSSLRGTVTTFIIAHRRSTLEGCDWLVEIRDGKLSVLERRERRLAQSSALYTAR